MMIAVGLLEVAGAIGLMIPILSGVAAIGLSALLTIITVVTLALMGPTMLAMPVACLAVALILEDDLLGRSGRREQHGGE